MGSSAPEEESQAAVNGIDEARDCIRVIERQLDRARMDATQRIAEIIAALDLAQKALKTELGASNPNPHQTMHHLANALGLLQFEDVLRQQVEHVQEALVELDEHLGECNTAMGHDQVKDMPSFRVKIESHFDRYVTDAQREVHQSVLGGKTDDDDRPPIELF
ncbi:hypothetical protein KSF73_16040 [Burkholderiaceae bacterium DAT-1]|nr:hypothetical protein [Burkholderiaceae bacterium DAT-1]